MRTTHVNAHNRYINRQRDILSKAFEIRDARDAANKTMKTKEMVVAQKINYNMGWTGRANIPAGTRLIPATNLPSDSPIKYWAKPWKGMTEEEKSWERSYGFGIEADMVKPRKKQ